MKQGIRLLLSLIGLVLFVLAVGVSCLIIFIDPNKLKPMLIEEVMKKTGYRLTIEGNISWAFYPTVALHIDRMLLRISNQPTPFLDLRDVSITTKLIPLLRRDNHLSGHINITHASLGKLNIQQVHVGLGWQHQVLSLQPITATVYGGTLTGIAYGRDLAHSLHWDWDVQLNHIQIKPLLSDLNDHQAKFILSGLGQIKCQAATSGKEINVILKNLQGFLSFDIREGVLEGIDLNDLIRRVATFINHHQLVTDEENSLLPRQTIFDSLIGSAVIENGVAQTNDVLLTSSAFTAKANGNINLLTQMLAYQLQVLPLHTAKIQWTIPVLITGDLYHPQVRLDTLTLNTLIAREQLDQVKVKVQQEIQTLPEKANQFINHLLGQ